MLMERPVAQVSDRRRRKWGGLEPSSSEPRFVVEHHDGEALLLALRLWPITARELGFGDGQVRRVARFDRALVLERPTHRLMPEPQWEDVGPLPLEHVPALVLEWLEGLEMPEEPFFDGGARRGFRVYCPEYGSEDAASHYGDFVVVAKWFEIHK